MQVHKKDMKASDFVRRNLCIPKRADLAVMHTRFPTKGSPEQNENNHPIIQGDIVGVHNGWFTNEERLWGTAVKRERRTAEVDSEVIFAMLAHGYKDSGADVIASLEAVRGNMAVGWLDATEPDTLYLARGHSSPLFLGQTEGGSAIFASTELAVAKACQAVGLELTHLREVDEGTLLFVQHGRVLDARSFKPEGPTYTYSSGRSTYGGSTVSRIGDQSWDDEFDVWDNKPKSAQTSAEVFTQGELLEELDGDDYTPALDWLDRRVMDPAYPVDMDKMSYYHVYESREQDIDDWFGDFRGGAVEMQASANAMKVWARPGDYVTTTLNGETVPAQIVMCPYDFPNGEDFVLRCFLTRKGTHMVPQGVECVLVERHHTEFQAAAETSCDYSTRSVVSVASMRNR